MFVCMYICLHALLVQERKMHNLLLWLVISCPSVINNILLSPTGKFMHMTHIEVVLNSMITELP